MIKYLHITLKSDMCAGSGYSYAGVIDSDTCFDEYGLPFIPARRIKGCLREAAELLGEDTSFLGVGGQGYRKQGEMDTRVSISDARIENYEEIAEGIRENGCLTKEMVLKQYTNIRSQTALDPETGAADRHSLRFTRVVNHFDPISEKELVMIAPILIEGDEEAAAAEQLKKLAKALRHIGLKRNRGLGNVRCRLEDEKDRNQGQDKNENGKKKTEKHSDKCRKENRDSIVTLRYTICNESPLMISKSNNQKTETYINGQTVLGFFASQYLKKKGNAADIDFENRFLREGLQFTPLYPSDACGNIYYPAPAYIACLKKSKAAVNSAAKIPSELQNIKEYNPKSPNFGNQPKKLKGKYVREDLRGEFPKEVDTEVIFHHRHAEDPEERQLYVSHAISKGQYFTGMITGKAEFVQEMEEILNTEKLSFGKSRNAQYGTCRLASAGYEENENTRQSFHAGDRIFVVLRSDAVFCNDCNYTVDLEEIRAEIQNALGIPACDTGASSVENMPYSEIEVKELTGYYSVWNLKRQALPVVCAGSTFEFVLNADCELNTVCRVGEKNGEGFGICHVIQNDEKWELILPEDDTEKPAVDESEKYMKTPDGPAAVLIHHAVMEEIQTEILKIVNEVKSTSLNASSVGRLTLMVEEAMLETAKEKTMNGETDPFKSNLDKRINSIKDSKEKREAAAKFVAAYYSVPLVHTRISAGHVLTDKELQELKLYSLRQALSILKYKTKEANGDD